MFDRSVELGADKFGIKFGMGCMIGLDRHVRTPPIFSVTFESIVYLTQNSPEVKIVTDL